ncbi:MAG: tetratricopeptide repeat protein [Candidatus Acidiferrum sp.]
MAAALVIALWLSSFAVRSAIARSYFEGNSIKQLEHAVRLEPGNPEYWYLLGRYQQYNLEQPDAAQAENSYRRAIELNPVDTEAWLDLGTAYELDGKLAEARQAYLQAQKSYPVSADVAWRYGNFLLRQGDQEEAYEELRRAIEADPERAAAAYSRAYRTNPNIDELLDKLLPAKQSVYVGVIWDAFSAKQLAVAKTVWGRLMALHPRLEMRDVEEFTHDLLTAGEYTEARQVWEQGTATMNLPPLLQLKSSVVWDPSFESDINGPIFSWRYPTITEGVSIGLDRQEKLSGKQSLRLSFDGKHDPNLETPCTEAIVQPDTRYRFSGWIKTKAITSDQGIGFRLRALDQATPNVVSTKKVLGTNPWGFVDQTWTSGPDVHRVEVCVTREASDNPDTRISGTAWIDDVNLVQEAAEHHKP